jgi:hypothetical protein
MARRRSVKVLPTARACAYAETEEKEFRSQADFINALRQVLGLDPLMPQADRPIPVQRALEFRSRPAL